MEYLKNDDENKIIDSLNNKSIIIIPKGIKLYRSISINHLNMIDNNNIPKCILCDETEKKGVYFSIISPVLSEFMALEYNNDMYIYVYTLNKDIIVNIGKYTTPIVTESHIEPEIKPISKNYNYLDKNFPKSYELFLQCDDLQYISFNYRKLITVNDVKKKYKNYCYNLPPSKLFEIYLSKYNSYNEIINNKNIKIVDNKYYLYDYVITNKIRKKEKGNIKYEYDVVLYLIDDYNNKITKIKHYNYYAQ